MSNERYIVYINAPNNKSVGHIGNLRLRKDWGGKTRLQVDGLALLIHAKTRSVPATERQSVPLVRSLRG